MSAFRGVLYTVALGEGEKDVAWEDCPRICFSEDEARTLVGYLVEDFDVASIWEHRFDRNGWAGSSSVERVRAASPTPTEDGQ